MSPQIPTQLGLFRVAVQGLVILAETGKACPSTMIAQGLDAHAVFVRRIMSRLVQAQIVIAREGRDGGYYLARPAAKITLAEVYRALKVECQEACHSEDVAPNQGIPKRVHQALSEIEAGLEQHTLELLDQYNIASLTEQTPSLSL